MTLDAAQRIIAAALKKSAEMDVKMNVTVVDVGGNLKAFVRMDDAYLGSADISMKKAKTAVMFGFPSGVLGTMSQPGGELYGVERSNGGLITFAGGLPLHNASGKLIGAIGVSGSSVANDEAVAEAGAAAL
ncbi:MAG: heme-binding protein [Candidatus Hydrogenedentota bacterium]